MIPTPIDVGEKILYVHIKKNKILKESIFRWRSCSPRQAPNCFKGSFFSKLF